MLKASFHSKIHYYSALLIAFCLPLGKVNGFVAFCLPFILLMCFNWIVEADFYSKFKTILNNKLSLLFITFYVLHIIGLLYTQNTSSGLFEIQVKLSLLIFPLLLTNKPFSDEQVKNIFIALIAGAFLSSITLLSHALYLLITTNENHFFYQSFCSILIHPSYLSMYMNVAIAWLLINLTQNKLSDKRLPNILGSFITLFFSYIIILLSSKSGIIALILIYSIYFFYNIFYLKKYIISLVSITVLVTSSVFIYKSAPEVSSRINELILTVNNKNEKNQSTESTYTRLLIWKATVPVITNNFIFGVGTGDVRNELIKEYAKNKMTYAFDNGLNAHNEYLQVFISLGFSGVLILLANLLFPLYFAIKSADYIYIAFILIIILNFLPESMLEAQAGTIFYGFFNSVLCFSKPILKQRIIT